MDHPLFSAVRIMWFTIVRIKIKNPKTAMYDGAIGYYITLSVAIHAPYCIYQPKKAFKIFCFEYA